jgi:hypothetical protein
VSSARRGELRAPNVKNTTDAALALRESGHMELNRLAIVVTALLLAVSMVIAAGRIASGEESSSSTQVPAPATRSVDAPVVRLGAPRPADSRPPRLLAQPTPPTTVTPRARQARESSSPDDVSGAGG